MIICNILRRILREVIFKVILFPCCLIGSPLVFLMEDGDCKEAARETKGFLKFIWMCGKI